MAEPSRPAILLLIGFTPSCPGPGRTPPRGLKRHIKVPPWVAAEVAAPAGLTRRPFAQGLHQVDLWATPLSRIVLAPTVVSPTRPAPISALERDCSPHAQAHSIPQDRHSRPRPEGDRPLAGAVRHLDCATVLIGIPNEGAPARNRNPHAGLPVTSFTAGAVASRRSWSRHFSAAASASSSYSPRSRV